MVAPTPALGPAAAQLDLDGNGRLEHRDAELAREVADAAERLLVGVKADPAAAALPWNRLHRAAKDPGALAGLDAPQLVSIRRLAGFVDKLVRARIAADKTKAVRIVGSTDEIESLDLSPFWAAGLQPVFITDLDDTAWRGQVSMEPFVTRMLDTGRLRPAARAPLFAVIKQFLDENRAGLGEIEYARMLTQASGNSVEANLQLVLDLRRAHLFDGYHMFLVAAAVTAGHTRAELDAVADEIFAGAFYDNVYPAQLIDYDALGARGVQGWAVSAGLEFLAQRGARELGFSPQRVRGSTLRYDESGRSRGVIDRRLYETKADETLAIIEEVGGMAIAFYGDSMTSDVPAALVVDLVDQVLDPGDDPHQNALRAEIKATRKRTRARTDAEIARFNASTGARLEATGQPLTR